LRNEKGEIIVVSTLTRKSLRDLSKKRGRTVFTIITIALGVASMGLFAVMPLMDQAILDEIDEANIYNIQLEVTDVGLNETNKEDLSNLDNVKDFEARVIFFTRIYNRGRRDDAIFIGVDDFSHQKVDVVIKDSGKEPSFMQVLTDGMNDKNDVFNGERGDSVRVIRSDGEEVKLLVTGEGHNILYTGATGQGYAIFYTTVETVRELGNISGYNLLSFVLHDSGEGPTEKTIEDIRDYLTDDEKMEDPVVAFANLPEVREDGTWPGQELFANLMNMFYVMTVLAVFCSVFLISNTMHTIVSEQHRDIASMKAIGATGKQVMGSYLITSFIMGGVGAIIGGVIGIGVTAFFVARLGNGFFGLSLGFGLHLSTVILSVLVGIGITILASLPALRKSLKVTVREALESHGITSAYGTSGIDKILMKTERMPRTIQIGIRNIGRKKGRSISTLLQVALAIGALLGVMAVTHSLQVTVGAEYDNYLLDIAVEGQEGGGKPLTVGEIPSLEELEDVKSVEPFVQSMMETEEENQIFALGLIHNTTAFNVNGTTVKGDWFTAEDEEPGADPVVVVTEVLVRKEGMKIGDTVTFMTATGLADFRVVGISSSLRMNGMTMYFPFGSLMEVLQRNGTISGFYIRTESSDHDDIDRTSTLIEDTLIDQGFMVNNDIMYVVEEQNERNNAQITNLMALLGGLIVLITLIGLMNTLTMNVLERTKEIGILRCIGSRARDIRWVFGSEGMVMALIGWIAGIPVGYLLGRFIWWMFGNWFDIEADFLFPALFLVLTLGITILMTVLIIQLPLRRAARMKPGDALRYE